MSELRWLLLVIGLLAVAAIYLYTRYKPRLDRGFDALTARREPTIDRRDEVPELVETLDDEHGRLADPPAVDAAAIPVLSDAAVAPAEQTPPRSKIVTVRLMARETGGFPAEQLILAMRDLGLQHGEFGIFHRAETVEDGGNEFSVASLVEPGSFDLTQLKSARYPGVTVFMQLPGPRAGVEIFDDMLTVSHALARELDGELLDEQGSTLSVQRERYLREEVIQFEHQGQS